jgi:hypothetical protein
MLMYRPPNPADMSMDGIASASSATFQCVATTPADDGSSWHPGGATSV